MLYCREVSRTQSGPLLYVRGPQSEVLVLPQRKRAPNGRVRLLDVSTCSGAYSSGGQVRGRVVVEVDGTLRFRSLAVTLRGRARVAWKEGPTAAYFLGKATEISDEVVYVNEKK